MDRRGCDRLAADLRAAGELIGRRVQVPGGFAIRVERVTVEDRGWDPVVLVEGPGYGGGPVRFRVDQVAPLVPLLDADAAGVR